MVKMTDRCQRALDAYDPSNKEGKFTELELSCWGKWNRNNGGFNLGWVSPSYGCGEVTFIIRQDGTIHCDHQAMNKEFVMSVFAALLEKCTFEDYTRNSAP